MPTFKIDDNELLEPLDYDFRPYHDSNGTVPEPTDDQVAEFYADLARQLELALPAERLEGVDLQDPAQVARLFVSLEAGENAKLYDTLLDTHAKVCSGSPSRDAIAALPFRARRAFYGMVQGWLRPEA